MCLYCSFQIEILLEKSENFDKLMAEAAAAEGDNADDEEQS